MACQCIVGSGATYDTMNAPPAPMTPLESAPEFKYYGAHWARPPFPPGWTAKDYMDYAASQIPQLKESLEEARLCTQHIVGHPLQAFAGWIDLALEQYDLAMVTIIDSVAMGGDPQRASDLHRELRPLLMSVIPLTAAAMTKAAEVGFEVGYLVGWAKGWEAGWKARDEDADSFSTWLKKLLATGGVSIAVLGAFALAVLALRK